MDEPAIAAFEAGHRDRRVRGAFRLVGMLLTLLFAFVTTLDSLEIVRNLLWALYAVPVVAFTVLGDLVVALRRLARSRVARIPSARVVRTIRA